MAVISNIVRAAVGPVALGWADYFRFPAYRDTWGGPFNGQDYRRRLFDAIMVRVAPAAIVETGTFRGDTTTYFAALGVPVHSVEAMPRNYGFARARMRRYPNVSLFLGDSRTQLRALFAGPLRDIGDAPVFVYLDAHWNADLPLAEEVDIVFSNAPQAVVMIDDFEVPGDPGYGFDDYGPGKRLDAAYLAEVAGRHGLALSYPATASSLETGAKRGSVVIGPDHRNWAGIPELRGGA